MFPEHPRDLESQLSFARQKRPLRPWVKNLTLAAVSAAVTLMIGSSFVLAKPFRSAFRTTSGYQCVCSSASKGQPVEVDRNFSLNLPADAAPEEKTLIPCQNMERVELSVRLDRDTKSPIRAELRKVDEKYTILSKVGFTNEEELPQAWSLDLTEEGKSVQVSCEKTSLSSTLSSL